MNFKSGFSKIKFVIAENSTIELGVLLTIISLCAWPMYQAIAKLENHETRISRSENDIKKIDQISDDVSYIKGVVDQIKNK